MSFYRNTVKFSPEWVHLIEIGLVPLKLVACENHNKIWQLTWMKKKQQLFHYNFVDKPSFTLNIIPGVFAMDIARIWKKKILWNDIFIRKKNYSKSKWFIYMITNISLFNLVQSISITRNCSDNAKQQHQQTITDFPPFKKKTIKSNICYCMNEYTQMKQKNNIRVIFIISGAFIIIGNIDICIMCA